MFRDILDFSGSFLKLARRADDMSVLRRNIGKYINFSDGPKFGIRYFGAQYRCNPLGIYGLKLTQEFYEKIYSDSVYGSSEYHYAETFFDKPLIHIFEPTVPSVVLEDVPDLNQKLCDAVLEKYGHILSAQSESDIVSACRRLKKPKASYVAYVVGELFDAGVFQNFNAGANVLYRLLGFNVVETHKEFFDDNFKHQLVVLSPTCCQLIATVKNPINEAISEVNEMGLWEQEEEESRRDRLFRLFNRS